VWAIGCVLYELCFLELAFNGKKEKNISQDILTKEPSFDGF
jgi:hypothetical protein